MTSDTSIIVRNLSKHYLVAKAQRETLIHQAVLKRLRRPTRGAVDRYWALSEVSLQARPGDVVGIIGRNGAGKSTLLKVLSRITEPTSGEVELYGRVGSLLEIGTGFNPELTGRENIFLNGAILGMRKAEIRRQLDAIVEFAGVESFIRTPVKRYSTGMYMRLAFAVAAHLNPEILIVDEVLAVGDVDFQKKCLGKMRSVASEAGRTVLFVSHNVGAVQQLCTRSILMDRGRVIYDGTTPEALRRYVDVHEADAVAPGTFWLLRRSNPYGNDHPLYLRELVIAGRSGPSSALRTGEEATFTIHADGLESFGGLYFRINVRNDQDHCVFGTDSRMAGAAMRGPSVAFEIERLPLLPGRYFVDVGVASATAKQVLDHVIGAGTFEVLPEPVYAPGYQIIPEDANLFLPPRWRDADAAEAAINEATTNGGPINGGSLEVPVAGSSPQGANGSTG